MSCGGCGQKYRPASSSTGKFAGTNRRRNIVQNTSPKSRPQAIVQPQQETPINSENNLAPKNPSTGTAESVITTGKQPPFIPQNSTGIDASKKPVTFTSEQNKVQGEE